MANGVPASQRIHSPSEAEQAVYAALKVLVYGRFFDTLVATHQWPQGERLPPDAMQGYLKGLTARRVRKMLTASKREEHQLTELYGADTRLVSQRLMSLNHGSVLRATERKLRRNRAFEWNEPIFVKNLCTFAAIRQYLGHDVQLGADLVRIHDAFGDRTFTTDHYVDAARSKLRNVLVRHSATRGPSGRAIHSTGFEEFLRTRMVALVRKGFVEKLRLPGPAHFRLTPLGQEIALYLDLFLHNIWFQEPVPACPHCTHRIKVNPAPQAG